MARHCVVASVAAQRGAVQAQVAAQTVMTMERAAVTNANRCTHLHPRQRGRRLFYMLQHWRYPEARRMLWQDIIRRLRRMLRSGAPIGTPDVDPRRWLHAGDLVLDVGGDELSALAQTLSRLANDRSGAIAYRSDIRLTARYGYHPVETVWLLEQAGYHVRLLTTSGPVTRPEAWFAPPPAGMPGPWLLAAPPGWNPPEVAT